jgi:hypothetical protein
MNGQEVRLRQLRTPVPVVALATVILASAQAVSAQPWAPGRAEAQAQEAPNPADTPTDLSEGKTPAQLFKDNCEVCHQRPNGLVKSTSARSLSGFLRQHYTSSAQTASAMARYLASLPNGGAAAPSNAAIRGRPSGNQATTRSEEARPPARRGERHEEAAGKKDQPAARKQTETTNAEVPAPTPKPPEIPL